MSCCGSRNTWADSNTSRRHRFAAEAALRLAFVCLIPAIQLAPAQSVKPIDFTLNDGTIIPAEEGEFSVPEYRANAASRVIPIRYVRLATRAEKPGPPIVYLAGGPGGSGTDAARGRRWEMFDRLRNVADVILLDQRGTGLSNALPTCDCQVEITGDVPTTREVYTRLHRTALQECLDFWEREGVEIRGYTTWESAADVEALRQALGADRVNLLGISYGTHLALAVLKRYPQQVDRVVLASAEGLDQTVKLPSLTDAYFRRLQAAIDADPAAAQRYPDVRALIEEVLDRVAADPPRIKVWQPWRPQVSPFDRLLGRFELQMLTGGMISDPHRVAPLLEAYAEAREGRYRYFTWLLKPTVSIRGMPEAMDLASGISTERLRRVETEARTALLGDALNFPMPHLRDAIPRLDLGDDFRASLQCDRPALLLSGTLDGRTYPEEHAEVAAGFSNGATVTIENAGHNLFFSHPELVGMIADFFGGAAPMPRTLTAPPPRFVDES